jgi:chaperonin GroES
MPAKLIPLGDKIVVERLEAESKTSGGIVLPDTAKEKPKRGKVIAVGSGRVLDTGEVKKPEVEVGDEVIFGSYAGTDVKIDEKEYLVLSESEILAKVVYEK